MMLLNRLKKFLRNPLCIIDDFIKMKHTVLLCAEKISALEIENQKLKKLMETHGLIEKKLPLRMCNNGILNQPEYLDPKKYIENQTMNNLYFNIANVFRGNDKFIRAELKEIADLIIVTENNEKCFVDIGCGQGLFMDILAEKGIKSIGIDKNQESAAVAEKKGHKVVVEDVNEYLGNIRDNEVLGISLIMVAEHISFQQMFDNIFLFEKKIISDGICIINTINPYCYKRYGHFHLDPSHVNYTPPELYKIIMEMAGFVNIQIIWSIPIDNVNHFDEWYTQYENFTIIGYKK